MMLSHGYPPTISGVTLIVQKFSRMLVKNGFSVRVVTGSDQGYHYHDLDNRVELVRLRSYSNPVWREAPIPYITAPRLEKLTKEFSPNLIHTHENMIMSTQLLKLRPSIRAPFLSSAYSLPEFLSSYVNLGRFIENLVKSIIWKHLINNLNRYDRVVFSNPTLREFYLKKGLSTPSSIISNGVDNIRYHPGKDGCREVTRKYSLPPEPRLIHVSRMARDKQIEVIIKAMPEIHSMCNAHLLVIGRGEHRTHLEQLIQHLELAHCVHMLGFIAEDDLPSIYRCADLFVAAGRCETQSLPALQALATGLPVVLADAACLPELVQHGENGYLVPPGDPTKLSEAVISILVNHQKSLRYGKASLRLGEDHAQSLSLRKLITLYQELAGGADHQAK